MVWLPDGKKVWRYAYLLSRCSQQRERLSASVLSIRSSVCLSVAKMQKNDIFSKTKQLRAMVFIDDLQEVVNGLFKEPIIANVIWKNQLLDP